MEYIRHTDTPGASMTFSLTRGTWSAGVLTDCSFVRARLHPPGVLNPNDMLLVNTLGLVRMVTFIDKAP